MSHYYILNDKKIIPCLDLLTWAKWFENSEERIVKLDKVGNYKVSTIFLGMDHNFLDFGPPLLFETMVFKNDSSLDEDMERYSTYDEAVKGHEEIVEKYKIIDNLTGAIAY